MITEETVIRLVEQSIQNSDVFLVEVVVKSGNVIKVLVDRPDGIPIEECVRITRFLNENLDRDLEDYSLEVSSPGLGAPFKVKQQYEKNTGRDIEVLLSDGSRLEGKLQSVSDHMIVLQVKGKEKEINLKEIKKTKAIITFN